jgi:hypothetical protein
MAGPYPQWGQTIRIGCCAGLSPRTDTASRGLYRSVGEQTPCLVGSLVIATSSQRLGTVILTASKSRRPRCSACITRPSTAPDDQPVEREDNAGHQWLIKLNDPNIQPINSPGGAPDAACFQGGTAVVQPAGHLLDIWRSGPMMATRSTGNFRSDRRSTTLRAAPAPPTRHRGRRHDEHSLAPSAGARPWTGAVTS